MSLFLSRDEVAELTGAHIKRRQIAVLVRNGIGLGIVCGGMCGGIFRVHDP